MVAENKERAGCIELFPERVGWIFRSVRHIKAVEPLCVEVLVVLETLDVVEALDELEVCNVLW